MSPSPASLTGIVFHRDGYCLQRPLGSLPFSISIRLAMMRMSSLLPERPANRAWSNSLPSVIEGVKVAPDVNCTGWKLSL